LSELRKNGDVTMLDTSFIVEVYHAEPEAEIKRFWISLVDDEHRDLTSRRSVILRMGLNKISLTWTKMAASVVASSALYMFKDSSTAIGLSRVPEHYIELRPGDTVTLNWDVTI